MCKEINSNVSTPDTTDVISLQENNSFSFVELIPIENLHQELWKRTELIKGRTILFPYYWNLTFGSSGTGRAWGFQAECFTDIVRYYYSFGSFGGCGGIQLRFNLLKIEGENMKILHTFPTDGIQINCIHQEPRRGPYVGYQHMTQDFSLPDLANIATHLTVDCQILSASTIPCKKP